jgi:hypothetical protein
MTRTMWIAVFCLAGLGPAIAIKVVTRPGSLAVEIAQDPSRTEMALLPNEAAKSDRLPLSDIRAESETMPAAQPEPAETAPAGPETAAISGRRWRDANAKALPDETGDENASNKEVEHPSRFGRNGKHPGIAPPGPPHRRAIAKKPIESASSNPPKPREVWHCRQDAMGSMLRSLDLSPRCNM